MSKATKVNKSPLKGETEVDDSKTVPEEVKEAKGKGKQSAESKASQLEEAEFKDGDYRIQVTILEAKDIIPKDTGMMGSNSADPLVEIEVLGEIQATKHKEDTLSPIYNETLFFQFQGLKVMDLEVSQLDIRIFDHNTFSRNSLLGQFSIDLEYIYQASPHHDIFHKWVAMVDPDDTQQKIRGYVKMSISVLGPGDKVYIHPPDDIEDGDNLLMPNSAKQDPLNIEISIFRAQHLAPLDLMANTTDAFVQATFGATTTKTKVVEKTRNPVFNQLLAIPASLPNMNKRIKLQVYDYDLTSASDLIGTLYLDFKQLQQGLYEEPSWMNIYGPNVGVENEFAQKMLAHGELGSHYRGRLLLCAEGCNDPHPKPHKKELKFSFPENPAPSPPEIVYTLSLFIYEGIELPQSVGNHGCFHVECGPYKKQSKVYPMKGGRVSAYERIQFKVTGPANVEEVPDIFIFHASGTKNSHQVSYIRLKAKDFLSVAEDLENAPVQTTPVRFRLEDDRSANPLDVDQFPGFLYIRLNFWRNAPVEVPDIQLHDIPYAPYILRVELYVGRDFPPADESGAADPFVSVRCAGVSKRSKIKYTSLNPAWFQTLEMTVKLPPISDEYPMPGINVLVFDNDSLGQKDLIGGTFIELEGDANFRLIGQDGRVVHALMHKPPQFYDLYYFATGEQKGRLFMGITLLTPQNAEKLPIKPIEPECFDAQLSICCVGLRELIPSLNFIPLKHVELVFDLYGDETQSKRTEKCRVKNRSVNFFQSIVLDVPIPINPSYAPVLTIFCYDYMLGLFKRLVGISSIPLRNFVGKLFQARESNVALTGSRLLGGKLLSSTGVEVELIDRVTLARQEKRKKLIDMGLPALKAPLTPQKEDLGVGDIALNLVVDGEDEKKEEGEDENEELALETKRLLSHRARVKENREVVSELLHKIKDEEEKQREEQKRKREEINARKAKNYECPDTDPDQDYDDTPEYKRGREILDGTLEEAYLTKLPFGRQVFERGQARGASTLFGGIAQSTVEEAGIFKSVIKMKEAGSQKAVKVAQKLLKFITPRTLKVRLYCLRARSLTPMDINGNSDPYLWLRLGGREIEDVESEREDTNDPNFYRYFEFTVKLPGESVLEIQVWDQDGIDDDLIGSTKIDLEDRYFSKHYQALDQKKPIEQRPLYSPKSKAPQGVLECFLEIFTPAQAKASLPWDITPPERKDFELRVIIWETKGVKFMDVAQGCNDLYVKGKLGGMDEDYETDVHWRCRGKGSFNYRWKFPMQLPLDPDLDYGKDQLKLSLWDRDVLSSSDMICEARIDLKDHNILQKAYHRDEGVKMKRMQGRKPVDQFWVKLTHPAQPADEDGERKALGQVLVSIEILPQHIADKRKNGNGREAPNKFPFLPEPKGRFSFDILSPCKTIKGILGPKIICRICCICWCIICCIVLGYLAYFVFGNWVSKAIIG